MVVNCPRFRSKQLSIVTALEKLNAHSSILQLTQHESFAELFNKFTDKNGEKVKYDLAGKFPIVDSDSTVRLRGQLSRTTVNGDLKYAIVPSAKRIAVGLMLKRMHENNLHAGTECVGSLVQERSWVIGLRNALLSVKSKCVKCRKLILHPFHPH